MLPGDISGKILCINEFNEFIAGAGEHFDKR